GRRLAWIGMVLTDPAYRRRGFARLLMEHAIEHLVAKGVEWIKLDATDMGAPLYRQLGFEDECSIERWGRAPGSAAQVSSPPEADAAMPSDLDLPAFGADRSTLLSVLSPLGCAAISGEAFALGRPGSRAAYFGPCVSRSSQSAERL